MGPSCSRVNSHMRIISQIRLGILRLPQNAKLVIALVIDFFSLTLSVWLSFYLRIGEGLPLFVRSGEHFPLIALAISAVLLFPIFWRFGIYQSVLRFSDSGSFKDIIFAMIVFSIIYVTAITIVGVAGVPKTIGLIQPVVLLALAWTSRLLIRSFLSEIPFPIGRPTNFKHVLIYGAGVTGREMAGLIGSSGDMTVLAFVDDDPTLRGRRVSGLKVLAPEDLNSFSKLAKVDEILLAMSKVGLRRKKEIVEEIQWTKVPVRWLPSYNDVVSERVAFTDVKKLSIDEILGREVVDADKDLMRRDIVGKAVLVTGAGGSIGSELCRQILLNRPSVLVLFEQTEFTLYQIYEELKNILENGSDDQRCDLVMILGSVNDAKKIDAVFQKYKVNTIYHAAAYKHVTIVEGNPTEGIRNNILGTNIVATAACEHNVQKFVLISTDKAVRPTSIMGATKRLAELILQSLDKECQQTTFAMVRFGNVLGSSGSVVPLFLKQIREGGPVTVTHRDVTRYFMTITEAAQLVIQAGAMTNADADPDAAKSSGAPLYLLDMGEPVRIVDLAKRMIELSGFTVFDELDRKDGDIEIREIGLRAGEKLHEELLISSEVSDTSHPKIKVAVEEFMSWTEISNLLSELQNAVSQQNEALLREIIANHFDGISRH